MYLFLILSGIAKTQSIFSKSNFSLSIKERPAKEKNVWKTSLPLPGLSENPPFES